MGKNHHRLVGESHHALAFPNRRASFSLCTLNVCGLLVVWFSTEELQAHALYVCMYMPRWALFRVWG